MKLNHKIVPLVLITLCILGLQSCKKDKKTTEAAVESVSPVAPEEYVDDPFDLIDEFGIPIILGKQERATIEKEPYDKWFAENYKEHTLDTLTVSAIAPQLTATEITVFMGTWCEDSQLQVPAFFKILDLAGTASSTVHLITINEDKDQPEDLVAGQNITNVPTIIFKKEGQELGRIVEYPLESLEKDMQKILNGEEYTHPYVEE